MLTIKTTKTDKPTSPTSEGLAPLLIIDDEPSLTLLLSKLFKPHYDIRTANSGPEALKILQEGFSPHVIICDQRMPEMTGAEFLQKSVSIVPKAIRVILTGYTDVNDIIASINQGNVYKFITKPWKNEELLQEIRLCFERYDLSTRNEKLLSVVRQQFAALETTKKELEDRNNELEALNKKLQLSSLQTVRALAGVLTSSQRHYYTSHSQTVAIIARAIGEYLKLPPASLRELTTAALLHDIGKANIPERIILTPYEKLKGEDKRVYESHVKKGFDILRSLPGLEKAAEIMYQHHERYDGQGYPDAKTGPEISIEAHILAVANIYHNLTYRIPLDIYINTPNPEDLVLQRGEVERKQAVAIRTIFRKASQFHPDVIKALYNVAKLGKCSPLQLGAEIPEEELEQLKLKGELLKQKEEAEEKEKNKVPKPKLIAVDDVQMGMILEEPILTGNVILMPKGKIIDFDALNKLKNLADLGKISEVTVLAPLEEDEDDLE